jgi:hypothetical protein
MGKAASQAACTHSYRVWTRVLSSTTGDSDGMTLWQHRVEAHDRGWCRHGESAAQCKPSLSPYRIMERVIGLRVQMTYRTDRRSMAWNHGWLPPSGDASRGHFLSATVDEEPSSRANEAWDAITLTFTY